MNRLNANLMCVFWPINKMECSFSRTTTDANDASTSLQEGFLSALSLELIGRL